MFRAALFALLASAVSASLAPRGDIPASSFLGMRLLSKATVVQPARHLDQNGRDVTFVAEYSVRYLGCSTLVQLSNGNNNGGNNNNNNQNSAAYSHSHLARFALCPTGKCSTCVGGGEYVMDMATFVDAFTEGQMTELEYNCEQIRENCYCADINDDEVCETQCFNQTNMTQCIQVEDDNEQDFEVQRYLECKQLEGNGNNNNNNNNNNNYQAAVYYMGPYCSPKDGFSIYLGIFTDASCVTHGNNSVYADLNGVALPYSTTSLVNSGCLDCLKKDGNNNNNNNNGAEVSESCQELYQYASKCEKFMNISSPDTSGCDFIDTILPKIDTASKSYGTSKSASSGKGAKAFATIFAFTTVLFAAYAYFLYRKIKRGSVDLSSQVA